MRLFAFSSIFLILVVNMAADQSQEIKKKRFEISETRLAIKILNKQLKNLPWPRKSCCMVYDPHPRWDKKKWDTLVAPIKASAAEKKKQIEEFKKRIDQLKEEIESLKG